MRKTILCMIWVMLLTTMPCVGVLADGESGIQSMTFVHYAKGQTTFNIGDETEERYKPLQHDLKWFDSFQYQIDFSNFNNLYLSEEDAEQILLKSLHTWQSVIDEEIFGGIAETSNHVVSWEDLSSGIIAQNTLQFDWYTGQILGSDVTFNSDYIWGDATVDAGVMDLQNIATHEFGHNGLRDLYDPFSTALTMFGFSGLGEVNKRTLAQGDIVGMQTVYGSNPDGYVELCDIDSGLTSPSGNYRWRDIASQLYADSYRDQNEEGSYNYTQATVTVSYDAYAGNLDGMLTAVNLKPNFAYQVKIVGGGSHTENHYINERIGLTGRWWMETWDGTAWTGGQNLNTKGDGSSPNPNDLYYFDYCDVLDATSPTGYKYKFTGYLVFDYFITDENGDAMLMFSQDSSYHVLWKTSLTHTPSEDDGLPLSSTFDPDKSSPAYDVDYGEQTVEIFGEWERLPADGIFLPAGFYTAQLILTEESFHESEPYSGSWAAAMGGTIPFTII